jgi:hypothetical protein
MPLILFIRMCSFWRTVSLKMVEATLKLLDELDQDRPASVELTRAQRRPPRPASKSPEIGH